VLYLANNIVEKHNNIHSYKKQVFMYFKLTKDLNMFFCFWIYLRVDNDFWSEQFAKIL